MSIQLCIIYGCFYTAIAELSSYGTTNVKYLLSGPLQKSFASHLAKI